MGSKGLLRYYLLVTVFFLPVTHSYAIYPCRAPVSRLRRTRKRRAHATSAISVVPPGTSSNTPELCGTESGERFAGNYICWREMYALCRSHFNAIPSIILAAPLTPRPDAIWIVWSGVNLESYLHYLANKGAIQRSDVITADTEASRSLMQTGIHIDDTHLPTDFDEEGFFSAGATELRQSKEQKSGVTEITYVVLTGLKNKS